MNQSKIFSFAVTCLLLICVTFSMAGCASGESGMHNFTEALKERRNSGWPIPSNVNDLVGAYEYSLTAKEVQEIGLSAVTDIANCEAVMEFYENGNGRIALYDERSKGPNPTSEAYDLEWYAEKIDSKAFSAEIYEDGSAFYLVKIAFYQHFNIEHKGEYILIQSANDSFFYERGKAQYENAREWLIIKNTDSAADESLRIPTIKLR